ncbi:MAG: hypothetical protein COU81_03500 [Candidatus Portnoybacteria bacterium CG10_big_fil_rev_8_21_14_0_10_36_7]|uniref:Uncharacterized protein n=1 Tax=Candidatus Portnoybacteria bacterium CG10_big_fil_rev_8_21_14_0_10_36_7 TaxID=1974812 RepID=A0A2M8KDD9_9BACT|nr:MAG: hypothetical protein COU81_03500 [Candidatus Portnoybacteria bacterium CG10_big_fil_rev_8_21_14_0_10_36_7]
MPAETTGTAGTLPPDLVPSGKPERKIRANSFITFSQLENLVAPSDTGHLFFDARMQGGSAVDSLLVLAKFVFQNRGSYCKREEETPEWNLDDVFSGYIPTGQSASKLLGILYKSRPDFRAPKEGPTYAHLKNKLLGLWPQVAKLHKLDTLSVQSIMAIQGSFFVPSDQTAIAEPLGQIAARVVTERFDDLVAHSDYTHLARPDFGILYRHNGQTTLIQVQLDYYSRLKEEQQTTAQKHLLVKRRLGDYKDSEKKDLGDLNTAQGRRFLVYNWLASESLVRFRHIITWLQFPNGQKRPVFLIDPKSPPLHRKQDCEVAIEFIKEEGPKILTPMPKLSPEATEYAKDLISQAIAESKRNKLA